MCFQRWYHCLVSSRINIVWKNQCRIVGRKHRKYCRAGRRFLYISFPLCLYLLLSSKRQKSVETERKRPSFDSSLFSPCGSDCSLIFIPFSFWFYSTLIVIYLSMHFNDMAVRPALSFCGTWKTLELTFLKMCLYCSTSRAGVWNNWFLVRKSSDGICGWRLRWIPPKGCGTFTPKASSTAIWPLK